MEHHVSAMIQTIKHKPKQPARSGHQYIAYVKPKPVENKTAKDSKSCSHTYLNQGLFSLQHGPNEEGWKQGYHSAYL